MCEFLLDCLRFSDELVCLNCSRFLSCVAQVNRISRHAYFHGLTPNEC